MHLIDYLNTSEPELIANHESIFNNDNTMFCYKINDDIYTFDVNVYKKFPTLELDFVSDQDDDDDDGNKTVLKFLIAPQVCSASTHALQQYWCRSSWYMPLSQVKVLGCRKVRLGAGREGGRAVGYVFNRNTVIVVCCYLKVNFRGSWKRNYGSFEPMKLGYFIVESDRFSEKGLLYGSVTSYLSWCISLLYSNIFAMLVSMKLIPNSKTASSLESAPQIARS